MPLELRRCPASSRPASETPVGPEDNDLLTAYLALFGREARWPRRSVTTPLLGLDSGFTLERSLKIGVRAASIYLAGHDAAIVLTVPEDREAPLTDGFTADLAQYIAQRYQGGDGGLFDRRFQRFPPPRADMAMPMSPAAPRPDLENMLRHTDAGFSETLLKLIDRTGKKDAEIYKRANVDRKLFSKIRSNPAYKPSKPTAVAFAIALELDLEEARDFIGRAGYALTHSSKFDIIVEYFILQKNYDVFALNETLFAFDQPLLGA